MRRWTWTRTAVIVCATGACLLSACTIGPSAGIGGAALTALLVLLLAGGTATTQSGCSSDTRNDDWDFSDTSHEDTREEDTRVGPCLSIRRDTGVPPRDTGADTGEDPDTRVGPCLSPPLDTGTPTDSGPDARDVEDAEDTTDAEPEDTSEPVDVEFGAKEDDRSAIIAKVRDRLPEDVAERLEDDEEA